MEAIIADAAETSFGGPRAEATAARFEEAAHAAWQRGRDEDAKRFVATARAFREQSPRENPVARAMLERALGPLVAALDQQDAAARAGRP